MEIKKYRDALGWSLERLAGELHREGVTVTKQTLWNYETGKTEPRGWALLVLARVLGVEPRELYEEVE